MTFPLLTVLALVPLVGGLALLFVKGGAGKTFGLAVSLVTLALGLWAFLDGGSLAEDHMWISQIGAHYALGLDGMAKSMVLLTVILVPVVLLADQSSQTVPIALSTLRGQHNIDITVLNAGSLLSLLPTLVFFLVFQRTLSHGVTAGAIK